MDKNQKKSFLIKARRFFYYITGGTGSVFLYHFCNAIVVPATKKLLRHLKNV